MACAGLGRGDADAAGVGEHVEHRLAGGFLHHPAPAGTQVEEQPWVLAGMTRLKAVADTEFADLAGLVRDLVLFGLEGVGDARVRLAAVVPDHRQAGECVGVEAFYRRQLICAEGAVEGLYQQQLAVAVDRQPGLALDGAVEQAVGVGLLGVEPGDEIGSCGEGAGEKVGNVRWHEEPYCEGGKAHMIVAQAGERAISDSLCHFWRLCALPDGTERALRATIETPGNDLARDDTGRRELSRGCGDIPCAEPTAIGYRDDQDLPCIPLLQPLR